MIFRGVARVAEFGRRAGLRIQWRNPWGFESPLSHRRCRRLHHFREIPLRRSLLAKHQTPTHHSDDGRMHRPPASLRGGVYGRRNRHSARRAPVSHTAASRGVHSRCGIHLVGRVSTMARSRSRPSLASDSSRSVASEEAALLEPKSFAVTERVERSRESLFHVPGDRREIRIANSAE